MLDLSSARREQIVAFAPRFWRPATRARQLHASYLGDLIDDPAVVSLRTAHGFLFAAQQGDLLDVDDMALDDKRRWPDDGHRLLRAAAAHGDLRFVCPIPEPERARAAVDLGMSIDETWWHRDLDPAAEPEPVGERFFSVVGGAGRLVDAPPVYAPGGPVSLARDVADAVVLAAIEEWAATHGAPVSVVSQQPDDEQRAEMLEGAGYKRTTDFFVWRKPRRERAS